MASGEINRINSQTDKKSYTKPLFTVAKEDIGVNKHNFKHIKRKLKLLTKLTVLNKLSPK